MGEFDIPDKHYTINGIQQIGVGTKDFRKSWDWFIRNFGFDVKILEDDTVAERMLPYTGGMPQKRHACIAVNLNGGGGLEIWQYSDRSPKPLDRQLLVGDLGVFAAKVRCRDVVRLRLQLLKAGVKVSPLAQLPAGPKTFCATDLYGNIFQVIEDKAVFIRQKHLCCGVSGALVGVSDMDRSIAFYRDVLGYETILSDVSGVQPDWKGLPGGDQAYRRVILSNPGIPTGAFGALFGTNTIELVQALDRTPSKIYEGRYWGDPGFIQICFDVTGMDSLGKHCAETGHPFTVDSCPDGEIFDMGEASGRFTYVEDPDGTLMEFVETYKVPITKGWYIDMKKRNPAKPLPRILFRAMGITSRQK